MLPILPREPTQDHNAAKAKTTHPDGKKVPALAAGTDRVRLATFLCRASLSSLTASRGIDL